MNLALPEIDQTVRLRFESPMTDDEIVRFCQANEAVRVEQDANGELIVMSPAGGGASNKNNNISYQLYKWADETGSGITFDSSGGFRLPDGSMRSPDAAWIAWPRWNALTKEEQERFAPICPEFVIELRSSSDSLGELQAKMGLWIANGAELAWLIDPEERAVTIYRPGQEPEHLVDPTSVQGDGPVSGFELVMARVWG